MTDLTFVCASTNDKSIQNWITELAPESLKYDIKYLCSQPKEKILKKDIDLDLTTLDSYKYVSPIGAEALKYLCGLTGITKYNGMLVKDRYIPLMNPGIINVKPQTKEDIVKALKTIDEIVSGKTVVISNPKTHLFIETVSELDDYIKTIKNADKVVCDIETTGLSFLKSEILGVAFSTKPHEGVYINIDVIIQRQDELRELLKTKTVIFHNGKFDMQFLEYHLGWTFPQFEDTMLLHYCLEEAVGTHGLKTLALKYTDLGDYERELDEYKKVFCRKNKIKLEDFNYGMLPSTVLSPYACLTHDSNVIMANGSKKTIGELVRTKSSELVRSFNHSTNCWENKPISGWYRLSDNKVIWYKIATSMTTKNSRWDIYNGPVFTNDHRVSTNNGYKEVQYLDITNDRLQVFDYKLTDDQTQILLGSLMGNGTLDSRNSKGARFEVSQSNKRKEYFSLKYKVFSSYTNRVIKSKEKNISSFCTRYTEQFSDINNSIIWISTSQDKKPYLSKEFLEQLDWLGLAIWYFDDANNLDNSSHICIRSHTISAEEQENVINILRSKFGIECEYVNDINNQFFNIKNYDILFQNISKYATPDLANKIPVKYHILIGSYEYDYIQANPYYAKIHNIVKLENPKNRAGYKTKWCIDVLDNHNFLTDIGLVHNCKDADASMQLYLKFKPLVDKNPKFKNLYENILIPSSVALRKMEKNGGPIDINFAKNLVTTYEAGIEEIKKKIYEDEAVARFERIYEKTFNPNSPAQLQELFFKILRLEPVKKTDSGAWSTDKEVLEELEHPLAKQILSLRKQSKIAGTYLEGIISGLDPDSRLRSGFNLHGTTSGRLSSSGVVNYQNIPRDNKDIKKMFRARPGYKIVQGDLKTAEVYYAAVLSKDPSLQKAFIDKVDFHSYIAKQIFNLPCKTEEVKKLYADHRQWAKAITFGVLYGAGPAKIAETANVSYQEAKHFIHKYFNEASFLKSWIDEANSFIEENAYIYSFFGRKRRLPESKSPNRGVSGHAIRSGVNFLVQSVASDINLLGLVDSFKWIDSQNYHEDIIPFTIVHDSIVAEVKEDLVYLWATNMKKCIQIDRGVSISNCPIEVDFEVGDTWGDLVSLKI